MFKRFIFLFCFWSFSCQEAEYNLDNPFDPANMDLVPPALFFHPPKINASLGQVVSVELYGLELDSAAAAHLKVKYDWGRLKYEYITPNEFFTGINNPVEIIIQEEGLLDIYIYYLPDMQSSQNEGGTWSLASIYFTAIAIGESDLEYDPVITILRDSNNDPVFINEFGMGKINID